MEFLVLGIGGVRCLWKGEEKLGFSLVWWFEILFISSRFLDFNLVYVFVVCFYLFLVEVESLLFEAYK